MKDAKKLEKIVNEYAKKYCAPVGTVKYTDKIPTASIDMVTYDIEVGTGVYNLFPNLDEDTVNKGLMQHEYIGHSAFHPFDAKRAVAEYIALMEAGCDEKKIDWTKNIFDDMVANIKVDFYGSDIELNKILKEQSHSNKIRQVTKSFYQDFMKKDFGMNPDAEIKKYVTELKNVKFLSGSPVKSVRECRGQVTKFYKIMKPLIDEENSNKSGEHGSPDEGQKVSDLPNGEIEKAVKELISGKEISKESAKRFLKEYASEKAKNDPFKSIGGGPGKTFLDQPDVYANLVIYDGLSENYEMKIKKINTEQKGGAYPSGYSPWGFSDSITDIDPFNSYGLVVPDITKKIERKGINTFGNMDKTPDLLLLLDDSGSMSNPIDDISVAVLASFVAAKNYVLNGAEVSPVRFSDRTTNPGFMHDKNDILNELLKFKSGGDTEVDLDALNNELKGKKYSDIDCILISDGRIGNRNELIRYLSNLGRSLMIEVGGSGSIRVESKVKVYPVNKGDDLANIVMGEIA